jgi:hypothetical protein
MRASDRDREASAAILRSAYLRGELSTQTLDWRMELALGARTREQLRRLTDDVALPALERVRRWLAPPPNAPVVPLVAEVVLGRHPACEVHLEDDSVSRRHAALRRRDGIWMLVELGSTNGTWVNGRRVTARTPVRRGDLVQLGQVQVRLG